MLSTHLRLAASHLRASAFSIGVRAPVLAFSTRPDIGKATEEGRKIFVGNLSFKLHHTNLREIMEGYGEVQDVWIVKDRETGKSKGYGFVTFASASQAQSALVMNGQIVQGRNLTVNMAQPRLTNTASPIDA